MTEVLINGYEGTEQFSPGDQQAYFDQDMSPELTAHQLEMVLQSELFREGLQSIVAERLPTAVVSGGLPYGGRVVGPVTPVGDIRGVDTLNYTKGEKVARGKLASCYRLADVNGWSQGVDAYLSARLQVDSSVLIAPSGLTYDEVTASSLIKVNEHGEVIDSGTTTLGVDSQAVALHLAVYSANSDLTCVIHIASAQAISVSTMKCGLLPLCQEAMAAGDIEYVEYAGDLDGSHNIRRAFASREIKVVFIRNSGVLVAGESIEEAFLTALNVMTAVSTQMNLVPVGLNNVFIPSRETRSEAYQQARELPAGVTTTRNWRYGELEFEALMRQLDNAGYRTGHVYRDQATCNRHGRSSSEADVTPKKLSISNDSKDLSSLNLTVHRKGALAAEWVGSPNVYHREEVDQPNGSRKVMRWISETTEEQWVSESGKPPRSKSTRLSNPNQFAPQGGNPNELKQKVKEIRKEYFEDTITAGPQSTVLEGVTWEEAQRIKDGQTVISGIDNVRVTAASRGIIQREHQRDALFYKNYAQSNPFERITKDDLEAYKREVEKKSKRGYGRGAGGYTSAESESEYIPDNRPMSAPLLDHGTFSLPPRPAYSPVDAYTSEVVSKTSAAPRSPQIGDDDVFRDMPRSSTMPLPKQQTRGATPTDHEQASDNEAFRSAGPASSVDGSEAGTLPKDKKKKRGFRLPSFSKKKDKDKQ